MQLHLPATSRVVVNLYLYKCTTFLCGRTDFTERVKRPFGVGELTFLVGKITLGETTFWHGRNDRIPVNIHYSG